MKISRINIITFIIAVMTVILSVTSIGSNVFAEAASKGGVVVNKSCPYVCGEIMTAVDMKNRVDARANKINVVGDISTGENAASESAEASADVKEKKGLSKLKKKLNKELKGQSGSWSVYVKNLDTNEYLLINNKKLPSASLIKLYVMMTVCDEIEAGRLKESKSLNESLKSMITVSDNEAANALTRKLTKKGTFKAGIKKVNAYCRKQGYSKTKFLVEMGKSSPKNVTGARDCGLALERMYRKTCVSKAGSKKMLRLLKAQTRRGKIPAGIPKGVIVANKTGETSFAENDAAIVYSKGADYVIVVMSRNGKNSVNEIKKLSKVVYEYFN